MTNNETREQRNLYRGSCIGLKSINEVPIDIAALVKENRPVSPDEPVKRFLPVMAQISWFKLRHGEEGTISTDIVSSTDMQAVVRADILVNGKPISNAYGSANALVESNGNNGEYWLIETAESRAVSRALRYAGFGCQLDLDYIDEDAPSSSTSSIQPSAEKAEPSSAESEAVATPGTVSGKDMKLDANATSCIIDIHDLEPVNEQKEDEPTTDIQPATTSSHRRTRKVKGKEATAEVAENNAALKNDGCLMKVDGKYLYIQRTETGWDYTVYDVESKKQLDGGVLEDAGLDLSGAITRACEQQSLNSKNINVMPLQLVEELEAAQLPDQSTIAEPETEMPGAMLETEADTAVQGSLFELNTADSDAMSAPETTPQEKSPEEQIKDYVQLALQCDSPDPILDPEFFGEQNQDPEACFINEGKRVTKMRNRDLQWAIDFLDSHKDLLMDVKYPAPSGSFANKTYRQLFEECPQQIDQILEKAPMRYYGANFPNYAALLLILKQRKYER